MRIHRSIASGRRLSMATIALALLFHGPVVAQSQEPALPKGLTAAERGVPIAATDVPTPPPEGPIHCAAEYESMDGILLAWEGSSSWKAILEQMATAITTTGHAKVYVYVDSTSERASAANALAQAGADMSRVEFRVFQTDSIWIRDYGPRYVFVGDCRAVIDHTYNRPRPNDNQVPRDFGASKAHGVYELPLVHGGGNFHLDALGEAHTTRLILNENPGLSQAQVAQIWRDYQNLQTAFYDPFPTSVDATQHIDMWMQVFGDRRAMVSDWPFDQGSVQDRICDGAAATLQAQGYTVSRVPARLVAGTHYTYTNVVVCNDLILVPRYTRPEVVQHNAQALAAWQAAAPGKIVVTIDCQALVTAAGVMHCICMHVPSHRGGTAPTAFVRTANDPEAFVPGQQVLVEWLADDDEQVTAVDIAWSADGGQSWPYAVASGVAHTGSLLWTVPDVHTTRGRFRVVARDAQGREGRDVSDADFSIVSSVCQGTTVAYGVGKPGQNGVPVLDGSAARMGDVLQLSLGSALPGAPFLLAFGARRANVPFDGGTLLLTLDGAYHYATDATGAWSLQLPVPSDPAVCGYPLHLQAWIPFDPGAAGQGWAASRGLALTFGW